MSSPVIPVWATVSRETLSQLEAYVALLTKWNGVINLVSPSTLGDIWERHIWDSYQLADLLPPHARLADIGSGGGLPGLVLAIARPDCSVVLIERDRRKAAFLTEAARALGLTQLRVVCADILDIQERFSVVTARALAALPQLCDFAHGLLEEGGVAFLPKGRQHEEELTQARAAGWQCVCEVFPSRTEAGAAIISISELKKTMAA